MSARVYNDTVACSVESGGVFDSADFDVTTARISIVEVGDSRVNIGSRASGYVFARKIESDVSECMTTEHASVASSNVSVTNTNVLQS